MNGAGLAVSLAAKEVIANFFGGVMIFINRPFSIGESIKSPNKQFEGVVEEIGWYMTRICTLERVPMYIPNAMITEAIIENAGRMYFRYIKTRIGLRYEDVRRIDKITEDITNFLKTVPGIVNDKSLSVSLVEFAASDLQVEIQAVLSIKDIAEFRKVRQEIFLQVARIIEENGAEIPFPTTTVFNMEKN